MTYLKLFVSWAALLTALAAVIFRSGAESSPLSVIFESALILGVLGGAIAAFIHKWIIEAGARAETGGGRHALSVAVAAVIVLTGFVYVPIPIIIASGYVAQRISRTMAGPGPYWPVWALIHAVVWWFVLKYGVLLPLALIGMTGLGAYFLLAPDHYAVLIGAIVFYEWYRGAREKDLAVRHLSPLWFILLPTALRIIWIGVGMGWAVLAYQYFVLIGIIVPALWIAWREWLSLRLGRLEPSPMPIS